MLLDQITWIQKEKKYVHLIVATNVRARIIELWKPF